MSKTILLCLNTLFLTQGTFSQQSPVVQISNGKIIGRVGTTSENTSYYAFEKIPYAAAPVGDLRFKPPQPASNWDGIFNATNPLDVACHQVLRHRGGTESEDCLFLNVFTPKIPKNYRHFRFQKGCDSTDKLLPVMVYIYGGGFMTGASYEYPPDLFVNNGVILVTLNYRLGVFGFISTQDDLIPGNNGLKDQAFALSWIQKNIRNFGGDPGRVTIFGQSSGGGSSSYHLLNPNSLGLLHGAIIESGSCLSPGMYQRESRKTAFTVGAILNSTFETNNDSKVLLEYLRSLDAQTLNAAAEKFTQDQIKPWTGLVDQGNIWAPVIEAENPDAFLTKKMYGLLEAGKVLPVPVMMGFTSEEAIIGNGDPVALTNLTRLIDANLDVVVPKDMRISDLENRTKQGELIRKIYTGGKTFTENLGGVIRYASDNLLSRAMIKQAELLSKATKTYFYQFSYDGIIGNVTGQYDGAGTVGHTEELKYLFCSGTDCTYSQYPAQDLLTRRRLIKLWTNFAKYQNPTPKPEEILGNVVWPCVSTTNGDFLYMNINSTLEVLNHPKQQSYVEWLKLYDQLGFNDFDTF